MYKLLGLSVVLEATVSHMVTVVSVKFFSRKSFVHRKIRNA